MDTLSSLNKLKVRKWKLSGLQYTLKYLQCKWFSVWGVTRQRCCKRVSALGRTWGRHSRNHFQPNRGYGLQCLQPALMKYILESHLSSFHMPESISHLHSANLSCSCHSLRRSIKIGKNWFSAAWKNPRNDSRRLLSSSRLWWHRIWHYVEKYRHQDPKPQSDLEESDQCEQVLRIPYLTLSFSLLGLFTFWAR